MTDPAPQAMTEAEYLASERQSPHKREYVGGFVYPLHAQAGTSGNHARISLRIAASLLPGADAQGCRVYTSDMQVYVPSESVYFYPDVMLACGGEAPHRYHETAPCFIAEVTSGSTAHTDRRHKYSVYTGIPSLQTYLIAAQDERYVIEYQRDPATTENGGWRMREVRGEGEVSVPCLGLSLTLDDIYRNVIPN